MWLCGTKCEMGCSARCVRERYWCDMVRNDGGTWNVVWFGIMSDDV